MRSDEMQVEDHEASHHRISATLLRMFFAADRLRSKENAAVWEFLSPRCDARAGALELDRYVTRAPTDRAIARQLLHHG